MGKKTRKFKDAQGVVQYELPNGKIVDQAGYDALVQKQTQLKAKPDVAAKTNTGVAQTTSGVAKQTTSGAGKGVSTIDGIGVPAEYVSFFTTGSKGKPRLSIPSNTTYEQKQGLDKFLKDNQLFDNITQGGNDAKLGDKNLFFAGLQPEDYEYKFAKGSFGEGADEMTPQARRDTYFDFLGLDPKYKGKGVDVYNDPEFKKEYYKKFTEKLPAGSYRAQLKDDFKFGFEHYDNIPFKAKTQIAPAATVEKEKKKEEKECPDGYWFKDGECVPIDPGMKVEDPGNPGKIFRPDAWNIAAAQGDRIFKGYPILPQYSAEPGDVAYEDYATQVANLHSGSQQAMDYINQNVTSGQAGVGLAAGMLSDNLTKSIGTIADVQNRNVNRYNDFSKYASQVENQENMLNTNARKNYQDEVNKVEQNYSDELDMKDANLAKMYGQAYKNEQKASILEELFPNARRKSRWDPSAFVGPKSGRYVGDEYDTYTAAYGSDSSDDSSDNYSIMKDRVSELIKGGMKESDAIEFVSKINKQSASSKTSKRKSGNPYEWANTMKNGGNSTKFGVFLQGGIFD